MNRRNESTRRGMVAGLAAAMMPGVTQVGAARGEAPAGPEASDSMESQPQPKRRWGMAIDLDLCSGCGACVVACKAENNVPMQGREPEHDGCGVEWMSLLPHFGEAGPSVGVPLELVPTPCFHCENPPCIKVCPVNATYRTEEGLVAQIWERCIGCRYCVVACGYSRRSYTWKPAEWPESYRNMLNPDVAMRPRGMVEKCTFCYHRIRKLDQQARIQGREVDPSEYDRLPACAQSCPAGAIVFGDLNDPESRVSRMAGSPRADRQHVYLGTRPKVFYLARNGREL